MTELDTTTLAAMVPDDVRGLCGRLRDAGFRSWVVGGCVRDELLADLRSRTSGKDVLSTRNDWDIATDAHPEQVMKLFRRVIPTGIKHGTVTVLLGDSGYEVTTLRGEAGYSDGRRPDAVYFVDDIVADLARRDFTINAIAYDPLEDRLIDPFDGTADLVGHKLRAVGDPAARFAEDGLRVLRAARFHATLEVEIEPDTARAIEPSLDSYRKVSPERIREEWVKAMKAHRPSRAFEVMRQHGMLAITAPELLESFGCEQNRHHAHDVWTHSMHCMDGCPPSPVLRISGLLHDIGKPRSRQWNEDSSDYTFYDHERIGAEMADPLLARLRFSTNERQRIVALVRHHLVCYEPSWSDAAVRRWIRRVTPELIEDLLELNRADILAKGRDPETDLERSAELAQRVESALEAGAALTVRDLAIGGRDLMSELGLAPGPLLGQILQRLLEEVLDDPAKNQRDVLLTRARELAEPSDAGS